MRTLVVYHSEHHGNTEKIAKVISAALDCRLLKSDETQPHDVSETELVGFGSGIYYGKFHEKMYNLIEGLPPQEGKMAFLFSTTGSKAYSAKAHELFKQRLKEKKFEIVGEYSCLGFDTALSPDGINLGRPNEEDMKAAREFAEGLKS